MPYLILFTCTSYIYHLSYALKLPSTLALESDLYVLPSEVHKWLSPFNYMIHVHI